MLRNQLPKYTVQELVRRQSTDPAAVTDALTTAFERLDGDMRAVAEDPRYQYDARAVLPALAGAVTILTCVVDRTLYVANAGDVRAVLGRESPSGGDFEAVALSIDHDAHNPAERARMFQEHPGEEEVVLKNDRVLGGLQPLRSFGDSIYKWTQTVTDTIRAGMQAGPSKPYAKRARSSRQIVTPPYVTARPEVVKHELGERDRFMVLATDGLWESMSNEQVVEFVGKVYREQICPAGKSIVEKDAVPTMIKSGENAATAVLRQSLVHRYPQDKWDAALHYILSIPAPYCRNVRYACCGGKSARVGTFHARLYIYSDDITITVVFFDRPDGKCADSLATEHQLPITTGVDPSSWREVVEDEIKRSSSKL